jgi:pyruvate kinase
MKRKAVRHVLKAGPMQPGTLAIIGTMGPRVSLESRRPDGSFPEPEALTSIEELVEHGMAAARINFSHVREQDFAQVDRLIAAIRSVEDRLRIPIPVIMDLKGPELRVREIRTPNDEPVPVLDLAEGDRVQLADIEDADCPALSGVKARLLLSYPKNVYVELERGNTVVIGDNDVYLTVERKRSPDKVICRAEHRGRIKPGKSVNLPDAAGGRLQAGPLDVAEDRAALAHGFDVDLIAQSFIQDASDVSALARLLERGPLGRKPIIAKIETPAAVADIDAILADENVFGIMVARGDLGVLVDFDRIPEIQRRLIDKANIAGKPVIVATQLLESMMQRPRPHRSEPQDIATAVEEGADALMLSGETAAGDFPLESVKVMARVIAATMPINRDLYLAKFNREFTRRPVTRNIHVIGHPICELAEAAHAPIIVSYATTGISAAMVSRFRPSMPVLAMTPRLETARLLRLLYGVHPVLVDPHGSPDLPRSAEGFVRFVREVVEELGIVGKLALPGKFIVGTMHNAIKDVRSRAIFTFQW